jgi:ubiquinone/menaquinone biosynthesis C-methylase UbiE
VKNVRPQLSQAKTSVQNFWNNASCGEELYLCGITREGYNAQASARYSIEPFIKDFARYSETKGKRILEIGVGIGADHQLFVEAGAITHGIDLTKRAVDHTNRRLSLAGLRSNVIVADCEKLPYADAYMDIVYSWGVLHHTPDAETAVREIHRVLNEQGTARIMLYHKYSIVGLMLWVRYALLRCKPFTSMSFLYCNYLESPGTKAYSKAEVRRLFRNFSAIAMHVELTHGDLLESSAGQRHRGLLLRLAKMVWPRWFIRRFLRHFGLFLLITATK